MDFPFINQPAIGDPPPPVAKKNGPGYVVAALWAQGERPNTAAAESCWSSHVGRLTISTKYMVNSGEYINRIPFKMAIC